MTLPRVLICAPIRYRPECPEVLGEYFRGLASLDWDPERLEYYFLHQNEWGEDIRDGRKSQRQEVRDEARAFHESVGRESWPPLGEVTLFATPDSRLIASRGIPSPRTTKETQLNLAYLRSRLFHYWEHQTEADLCLMVDSDVVMAPGALDAMWGASAELLGLDGQARVTLTIQINNCPFESGAPASNAQLDTTQTRAPWATDGSVIEVARAGACTLYPRAAARYRFTFDPTRHNEEHQGLFDRLREDGFRHYLLRDPALADHRMGREPDAWTALQKVRASQTP